MQKITTHLWFDKEVKEAAILYTSLFPDSKIENTSTIKDTPSGDCDIVSFTLAGESFMGISAGPYFKFSPSISFYTVFSTEEEIKTVWDKLIVGGTALMEYGSYPWAKKYGWLQDKFGLSWQLSWSEDNQPKQKITPLLMFTGAVAGKTREAIDFYTSLFPNSSSLLQVPYEKEEGEKEGFIKHSQFTLNGQLFMAMDSSYDHKFNFSEAISFIVKCNDQEEIDYFWGKLSAYPESEQCGWLKDKFGVSWQITPSIMDEMMEKGTEEQKGKVTQAFLKMKKFDIKTLQEAYNS
jgi:predicted 3-demethylubiquinone-9 3-methyltransferase (glyoxalase superfamily)